MTHPAITTMQRDMRAGTWRFVRAAAISIALVAANLALACYWVMRQVEAGQASILFIALTLMASWTTYFVAIGTIELWHMHRLWRRQMRVILRELQLHLHLH